MPATISKSASPANETTPAPATTSKLTVTTKSPAPATTSKSTVTTKSKVQYMKEQYRNIKIPESYLEQKEDL